MGSENLKNNLLNVHNLSVEEDEPMLNTDEDLPGSGGDLTRRSSISSCAGVLPSGSKQGKRRKRTIEPDAQSENNDEEENDVAPDMLFIRKERENLESFLFNEANKINRTAIKSILTRWSVLENKLQDLVLENEKLKVQLTCSAVSPTLPKSYAQAATSGSSRGSFAPSGPEKEKRIRKQEVILIKPKNEEDNRTNDEIKSTLLDALKDVKSKLKVKSIRQMRKKGLVIEVDSKSDVNLINQAKLEEKDLKLEEPKKLLPSIVIYDVEKDKNVEELKEHLVAKNFPVFNDSELETLNKEIVFRHSFPSKENKVNWIVQIPGRHLKKLLEEGRVFLIWRTYRIREFINITRCYKCFGYGHIAKNCNAPSQLCEICGSHEHVKADCKEKQNPKCVNCFRNRRKEINHHVRSRQCPEYEKQLEIYKSKLKWN